VLQEGLTNVEVVQGADDNPHLTPESLDAAVIMNAYHEMHAYDAMLRHLRGALKPNGRLVIVEPMTDKRRHESREAQTQVHEIALPFVEREARDAGFRIARTEDPFIERGSDMMWLLVAVPDPVSPTSMRADASTVPPTASAAPTSTTSDDETLLANRDLRIAFDRFKQLHESGAIIVIDVRSEDDYRAGHIPGATWIPLEKIAEQAERLRKLGQPIATYCS